MKSIKISLSLLIALLLAACGGEADEQREAKEKAADTNQSPVISCDWDRMESQQIDVLSWADESNVCVTMQTILGKLPTVALIRKLSKAIFIMQSTGNKDNPKDIAYQMMNIVEARGIENDNNAIDSTIETVMKIFNGTQGHVTPKDINIFLRSAGPMAKTLSDEGLVSMATLIWEDKKSRGK